MRASFKSFYVGQRQEDERFDAALTYNRGLKGEYEYIENDMKSELLLINSFCERYEGVCFNVFSPDKEDVLCILQQGYDS
ncbi:MAG: hypothetical protein Q8858_15755 [Bacteroidota bacterium]|nr:hypothetical protein [Bacteroidota bacterium]